MLAYGYGLLFAFLTSTCWGISPILLKIALREMSGWKANAFRGLGLLSILVPMFFLAGANITDELLSFSASTYLLFALPTILSNMVGDTFYFTAIREIGVSLAAPIANSFPLAVAVISWLWFGETLSISVLGGTLSIVAGLALMNINAAEKRGAEKSRHLRGVVSAFLTNLCWALGLTVNKYLTLHGVSALALTFWRAIFFSLMAIAFFPLADRGEKDEEKTRHVTVRCAFAAAAAGVVSLLIGTWFYATSLFIIPMNVATPISSASPLITAVFACAYMGESLRPAQWQGIVFVVAGAIAVSI